MRSSCSRLFTRAAIRFKFTAITVNFNPLCYRGYVYDTETGLYYLQSRYYDPELGRFINADGLVSTGQGIIGNNMFAYCLNNPVSFADPTGEIGLFALGLIASAVIGATVSAINTAISGGSVCDVLASAAIGAVSAVAITVCTAYATTLGAAAAIGAGIGAATEVISIGVEHAMHHNEPDYSFNLEQAGARVLYASGMGALSGMVSYGLGKVFTNGDTGIGTAISAEASISLGLLDIGSRQLISTIGRKKPDASSSKSVIGKPSSNQNGVANPLNISIPSIIQREPHYGYIV